MKLEELRKRVEELKKEGRELKTLKNDADTYRTFRKIIVNTSEYKQFD